jgi:PKHD-type hydroxylase|tara:strand:+ start:47 stop:619 length:573 start_codon:yes stop_codon:yes gene_type:complete
MRYNQLFAQCKIPSNLIEDTLSFVDLDKMKEATTVATGKVTEDGKLSDSRNANVTFINDNTIMKRWLTVAKTINKDLGWDFELDAIEQIQYGEYNEDQYYGWHIDQHTAVYGDGRVRKCSFSVFLNDDYEGGEFDLETGSPKQENRLQTFAKLPVNQMLFFQSDFWHQVRPVTKGVRKSLVGWVLGPKYK